MRRAGSTKQPTKPTRTNADAFADRKAAHAKRSDAEGHPQFRGVALSPAMTERTVNIVNDEFTARRFGAAGSVEEIVESPDGHSLFVAFHPARGRQAVVELVLRSPLQAMVTAQALRDLSRSIGLCSTDRFVDELRRDVEQRLPINRKWLVELLNDLELHRRDLAGAAKSIDDIDVQLRSCDVVEGIAYAMDCDEVVA